MKSFYKSKEVWVLGTAILIGAAKFWGLDFEGIIGDATSLWVGVAPVVALVLRAFWTQDKLTI